MKKKIKEAALAGLLSGVADFSEAAGKSVEDKWSNTRSDQIPTNLVSHAHQLASGSDSSVSPRSNQLLSPFCGLQGHQGSWFLPLSTLNPWEHNAIFPSPQKVLDPKVKIAALWEEMSGAWDQTNPGSLDAKIETLLALLGEYAWSIPSIAEGVSIYDLARTTAAIASCLVDSNPNHAIGEDAPVGILVSGDFSGLQNFLYTLASAGAAKSLRARSVYLQWLAEAITYSLLRDLGLPSSNVLYVGGGGFQLLVPLGAGDALSTLGEDLAERLLLLHNGALGLTLAWEKVTESDFADFGKARSRLGERLNRAKRRPFSGASLERLEETVGKPITQGGDPLAFCHVTGEDGESLEPVDGTYKSKFIIDLEGLGIQLRHATHLAFVLGDKEPAQLATGWQQALRTFGFHAYLLPTPKNLPIKFPAGLRRIWHFDPNVNPFRLDAEEAVSSYRPFAQLIAWNADEKRPKTFDELAVEPFLQGGFERWGVLRMDVDNLGTLFKEGYGTRVSIARSAGLSFALRLFFEGWLPQLAKGKEDQKHALSGADLHDHLYLQYSGGDDIFIVGAWDTLPEFARRIRASLREFTANNPHVTLSGGIEVFHAKFPLYQAAQQAGDAEHAAKAYQHLDGKEKDAITFLGQVISWETFDEVSLQAYKMEELVKSKALSHAALQTILSLNAQMDEAERQNALMKLRAKTHAKKKLLYGSWTWMAAYQLTRMKPSEREQKKDEGKKDVAELLIAIQNSYLNPEHKEKIKTYGLAARWAEFLTRGGK